MKTVEEIIEHLQFELADATEQHSLFQKTDKQAALYYFQKAMFIIQLTRRASFYLVALYALCTIHTKKLVYLWIFCELKLLYALCII